MCANKMSKIDEILHELKRIRLALEKPAVYAPGNSQPFPADWRVDYHGGHSPRETYSTQNQPMEQPRYAN